MSSRVRNAVLLGVALALLGAGAYVYARSELEARIRSFVPAVERIGYARGGRVPTAEELSAEARAAAEALGLEITALEVTESEGTGLDGTGQLAQDRMGDLGRLQMRLVRYDVQATVIARLGFLSRTGEVAAARTYRREVTLETPNARPAIPSTLPEDPPIPRGM